MATFALVGAPALAEPPHVGYREGRLLVQPRAGLADSELARILGRHGGRALGRLRALDVHVVEVPARAEDAVARALARNPQIQFAEKDSLLPAAELVPGDPRYADAWHLPAVQAAEAWGLATAHGVTIAILDTGVDASHPDLAPQLVAGWNAVNQTTQTSDIQGHGTKVAGAAAAATNNGIGVAAVGYGAALMPVRVSNRSDGAAYLSDIANGLTWAADNGADVANISYRVTDSGAVTNAARYMRNLGGLVVVAAGNDGADPGWADNAALVSVSATTPTDAKASWSNYGDYIDVAAPGAGILTTTRGGGYASPSGTSFASPVAAGVAGLIWGANPALTPDDVEAVLEASADDPAGVDWHADFGWGRVNAAAAVAMALDVSAVLPIDDEAPSVTIFSPADGSSVSGSVTVDVDATDNVGVTEVVLYAGTARVGTDAVAPYQFSWDSTGVADGDATLTAYAYDAVGNEGVSGDLTLTVGNRSLAADTEPPSVVIATPADGSLVDGRVSIQVTADDDVAVSGIWLYVDGGLEASTASPGLDYSWNTRKVADGTHDIEAVAADAAGNEASATITLVVGSQFDGAGSDGSADTKPGKGYGRTN